MFEQKPEVSVDDLVDNPLWYWCASMVEWDAELFETGDDAVDLVLSTRCATRFGIQAESDGEIAIGLPERDVPAFATVRWTGASLIRRDRGCFLSVVADDICVQEAALAGPLKLRVFFPISDALLGVFENAARRPETLRLRAMIIRKGLPVLAIGEARAEMPLVFRREDRKAAPGADRTLAGRKPPRKGPPPVRPNSLIIRP